MIHKIKFIALVTAVAAALAAPSARAADELKIAFIAYQNPEHLAENVDPVIAYLKETLGKEVKSFVATDYAGIVEALRNGSADIGFMGPLQYIIAHDHAGAIPLLGELYGENAYYTSRIFVRKDSGITSLEDLRGKTIAFTDPISSSGYLYPLSIFTDKKLFTDDPQDFFKVAHWAGGDEQALRAVFNKFVDAAGIGEFSLNLLKAEERDEITVIGQSRRIPSHCVVARKGLDAATRDAFRDALFSLNEEGPNHKLLQNLYGVNGYVKVTNETFAEVETMAVKHGIIKR
jgi:phosphonate transport system substrate-binding protein